MAPRPAHRSTVPARLAARAWSAAGVLAAFPGAVAAADGARAARSADQPLLLGDMLQVFAGLVVVLLVIAVSAYLARRYGRLRGAADGRLKVTAGLSVGQRERILIVQAGAVHLVVGVAPGGIRTLHVLDGPHDTEPPAEEETAPGPRRALRQFREELMRRALPS